MAPAEVEDGSNLVWLDPRRGVEAMRRRIESAYAGDLGLVSEVWQELVGYAESDPDGAVALTSETHILLRVKWGLEARAAREATPPPTPAATDG